MVLALEQERLPKTLYVDEPSPHVAWQGSGLALLREARPWAREAGRVRRAGVSSFGISGTNAHVVIEEAPREVGPVRRRAVPEGAGSGCWLAAACCVWPGRGGASFAGGAMVGVAWVAPAGGSCGG